MPQRDVEQQLLWVGYCSSAPEIMHTPRTSNPPGKRQLSLCAVRTSGRHSRCATWVLICSMLPAVGAQGSPPAPTMISASLVLNEQLSTPPLH